MQINKSDITAKPLIRLLFYSVKFVVGFILIKTYKNKLMKNLTRLLFTLTVLLCTKSANALPEITEQEAINLALKKSPLLNAANLLVQQQRQLQRTSFNIPNPDITLESPSGEFMTVGVLQSFEFPLVYVKQGQLFKQQSILAEKGKIISEAEVKQQVKTAYLNLQFAKINLQQLKKQDSIYFSINNASERQFAAGQIDFVAKTFAATQYGEVHNRYMQSLADEQIALAQLQVYTGITEIITATPLIKKNDLFIISSITPDSAEIIRTPVIQYLIQAQSIAKKSLQLEKTKALPGFAIGYMNQGLKNSEMFYRLRGGINIPLWFWQYHAAIKAAKTNLQITQQNTLANQQNLLTRMQQLKGDALKLQNSLTYYENEALKQADDLITSSGRMFSAGQNDYFTYLRTLSEAYNIQAKYLETIRSYNQTIININYLNGQ